MKYTELVKTLQDMEQLWGGNRTHPLPKTASARLIALRDNVQYFACRNSTGPDEHDLPIVMAVGINYSQLYYKKRKGFVPGPSSPCQLPARSAKVVAVRPPWVEDKLDSNYNKLLKHLKHYEGNQTQWVKETRAPHKHVSVPKCFHLVMTNFCPWITLHNWGNGAFHNESLRADLLIHPPAGPAAHAFGAHLDDLMKRFDGDHLWIGHGLEAIPQLFRLFVERKRVGNWLITKNLC